MHIEVCPSSKKIHQAIPLGVVDDSIESSWQLDLYRWLKIWTLKGRGHPCKFFLKLMCPKINICQTVWTSMNFSTLRVISIFCCYFVHVNTQIKYSMSVYPDTNYIFLKQTSQAHSPSLHFTSLGEKKGRESGCLACII